jgi:DNA-binding NtrC family response regulator
MAAAPLVRILVVDDIPEFVKELRETLSTAGFDVTARLSPLQAIKEVRRKPYDLLITTLVMRELGGFDVIRGVRNSGNATPIMMITGHGSEQAAAEAIRLGAADYINKPVEPEELVARVKRIIEPKDGALGFLDHGDESELITQDPAMQSVLELVATVAATNSRVLITGETGTGKQLIARSLHRRSPRRKAPFVEINCAAIPDTLLESELFGHERGAFTGADARRIGRFEEAGNGTIFLDEIGEMGYGMQAKLLKVLQDGEYSRVGGSQHLHTAARVLAATNRDLESEVAAGRFRSDLYFRLQVVTVSLPPLRKRPGDVPLLAEHFIKAFSSEGRTHQFAAETLGAMMRYHWPGNVRELENLVERLAVLHKTPLIGMDALPERIVQQAVGLATAQNTYLGTFDEAKARFERDYLMSLLSQTAGNMAAAARIAGLDRSQFFRMVKRQRIDLGGFTNRMMSKPQPI